VPHNQGNNLVGANLPRGSVPIFMNSQADERPEDVDSMTARLIEISERREVPSSSLAAKQARLLTLLGCGSTLALDHASPTPLRLVPITALRNQIWTDEVLT
jgi:hypothetical protein